MNRWIKGGWVVAAALAVSACGGGGGADELPSAETMCGSLGLQPKVFNGANCAGPERSSVILLNVVSSSGVSICSGSLLTPTKILTAGHCLPADARQVFAGLWRADGTVEGVPASGWTVHPQFQRTASAVINDAAVVTLSSALPNLTMGVLLSEPSSPGQQVYVAGWGEPGFSLVVGSAKLTEVDTVSIGYTFTGNLSNTCGGDSGGPAYRVVNGQPAVVGITSTGTAAACGQSDHSLFTNVQGGDMVGFLRSQVPEAAYY